MVDETGRRFEALPVDAFAGTLVDDTGEVVFLRFAAETVAGGEFVLALDADTLQDVGDGILTVASVTRDVPANVLDGQASAAVVHPVSAWEVAHDHAETHLILQLQVGGAVTLSFTFSREAGRDIARSIVHESTVIRNPTGREVIV